MLYPLTSQGVSDKLAQLYALPDHDLLVQARDIASDFKSWMISNFILSTTQKAYLMAVSTSLARYAGESCAFCFKYRLPITLSYPEPQPPAPTGYSKYWETDNKTKFVTSDSGSTTASGSLSFSLVWRESEN